MSRINYDFEHRKLWLWAEIGTFFLDTYGFFTKTCEISWWNDFCSHKNIVGNTIIATQIIKHPKSMNLATHFCNKFSWDIIIFCLLRKIWFYFYLCCVTLLWLRPHPTWTKGQPYYFMGWNILHSWTLMGECHLIILTS